MKNLILDNHIIDISTISAVGFERKRIEYKDGGSCEWGCPYIITSGNRIELAPHNSSHCSEEDWERVAQLFEKLKQGTTMKNLIQKHGRKIALFLGAMLFTFLICMALFGCAGQPHF